jgi:hypothetical protein
MLILEVLLLTACIVLALRQSVSRRLAGFVLLALAAVSGFGDLVLKSAGDSLQHVELPAYFQTTTIELPDARRIAFARSLQRVQRYSSDGTFERGWFVNADGGMLAGGYSLGVTADDRIVLASDRLKQAELYTVDGRLDGGNRPFRRIGKGAGVPAVMPPGSFLIDGVSLMAPVRTGNPRLGWSTVLPSLFLHSWTGWALFWFGLNLMRPTKSLALRISASTLKPQARAHQEPTDRENDVSAWAMGGSVASMFALIVLAILVFIVVIAVPTVRLLAAS